MDSYFKKTDDRVIAPRDEQTIMQSLIENLEHPAFERFKKTEEWKELKRSVEVWKQ